MSKLAPSSSQRLMNLLHKTSTSEVAPKIGAVSRFLYESEASPEPSRSYLDGIMENEWNQREMVQAVSEIPSECKRTNILKFECPNSLITKADFANIYPINRDRLFKLGRQFDKGLEFEVVKARNPVSLMFSNSYYLVFPNFVHSAVYFRETANKQINGHRLKLTFVEPTIDELKYMVSPFLASDYRDMLSRMEEHVEHNVNVQTPFSSLLSKDLSQIAFRDIYKYNPTTSKIISSLLKQSQPLEEELMNVESVNPNFKSLTKLINSPVRASTVLVRNLPFGLSKHTIPRLLWNYELNLKNPVTSVVQDPVKQINIQLIRFLNPTGATRFVHNFHGRRWDTIQHQRQEKKLYDPIFCEIIN
ncbi:hypothetical protein G9P44_005487 [Scheffersomyces stipitis]|nr:hypothetical protein G9P44_005487 [Scheffersomyces stipitis]